MIILFGMLVGFLELIDLKVVGLGELIFTIIIAYKGLFRRYYSNTKIFRNIGIYIFFLSIYFLILNLDKIVVLKNFIKWIIILIQSISIYNCLKRNEKITLKFMLSYLIIAKFIECIDVGETWFWHYYVLIFWFVLLLRYKNSKKYEILLYIVCIFYIIVGKARIALVLMVSFFGYKLVNDVIKNFKKRDWDKRIKALCLVLVIIVFSIVGSVYIYQNISVSTESNDERKKLIEIAIEEFMDSKIVGVGLGNYNNYAQEELRYKLSSDIITPHNLYLEILSECGIIGLILFLNILLPLIKILFKSKINLYTKNMIIYIVIYYLFSTFTGMNRMIFAVFIGTIIYYLDIESKVIKNRRN